MEFGKIFCMERNMEWKKTASMNMEKLSFIPYHALPKMGSFFHNSHNTQMQKQIF